MFCSDYNIKQLGNEGRFSPSDRLGFVLSRLEGVRKVGNGWVALCPAHDDHNPSLSIGVGSDGRILLHCFAGCSIEDICSALGIEIKDLFPENNFSDYLPITRSRKSSSVTSSRDSKLLDLFNAVYSTLISLLSLSAKHIKHLLSRGLTKEEVELLKKRGYRTLPKDALERASIAIKIAKDFGEGILDVPGFYATESNCPMFVGFRGGLFIPVRDKSGRIIGAQVRVDEAEDGGKYRWFSSSRYGGPSSGTPTHVAMPDKEPPEEGWDRAWIVEGVLKADICALKLGEPVVGIPGITAWDAQQIDSIRMSLGAKQVIIAFDADLKENEQVRIQRNRLADELLAWGADVWIAEWDLENGKGLDDLLLNGGHPKLKPFKRAPDLTKVRSNAVRTVESRETRVESQKMEDSRLSTLDSRLIQQLRRELEEEIRRYVAQPNGQVLLIRGFQGLGKTLTTLRTLAALRKETGGTLRPIYVAPRHDLLSQAKGELEARHIKPRAPRDEYDQPRCPLWELADEIARKRHSVPRNLCFAGACGHSIENCPYYRQFQTDKPLACVYEVALNETACRERLMRPGYQHVFIFDELDPWRFLERVRITKEDVVENLERCSGSEKLLIKLKTAMEKLAIRLREEGKLQLIGEEAINALMEEMGGEEEVEKLLSESKENPGRELVPLKVDFIEPLDGNKLQVWINGMPRTLPSRALQIVSPNLILLERWLAEKIGVEKGPEKVEKEPPDDLEKFVHQLPLNFVSDLKKILREKSNNIQIELTSENEVAITLLLLKRPTIPKNVPVIVIDPDLPEWVVEKIFDRPVRLWQAPKVKTKAEVIQIIDGRYGHHTLLHPLLDEPTLSAERIWRIAWALSKEMPEEVLVVTWKSLAEKLRKMQDEGLIPKELAIEHYGSLEGSNEYEERRTVILMGAPQAYPGDVVELALALCPKEKLDLQRGERWLRFEYEDSNGNGYEVKVTDFRDDRLAQLSALSREAELRQCAGRIRDVLKGGRIILLTNIPIPDLPPDQLYTLGELAERWEVDIDAEKSVRSQIKEIAREIVEREVKGALESGRVFQITVNGLAAAVLEFANCTEGYNLVRSVNFKKLRRYVREALIELEEELGLKRIRVDLPHRGRGGRRSFLVWATSVRIDVEAAKREHRYGLDHIWRREAGGEGRKTARNGSLPSPELEVNPNPGLKRWGRGPGPPPRVGTSQAA